MPHSAETRSRLQGALARRYERDGAAFLRRALIVQHAQGLVVGLAGALLTLLYASPSVADLAVSIVLAELIYLVEGVLALGTMLDKLELLERFRDGRTDLAREAWNALADMPFAPLRLRPGHLAVLAGILLWDAVSVQRLGFSASAVLLVLPGSLVVMLYWLALRFFVTEQLLRPALAEVGSTLSDGGGADEPRITLARRLLVAVPAITIITGTVVAGVAGDRTLSTLAIGVAGSVLVAATIASWLVILLADSIAGPMRDLRVAAGRVGRGDLDVLVPVVSVDETGALARAFNKMVDGLRERERIRAAFGTYVDEEVAEHILEKGTELSGEEVEVTALFLDIRNFTGYAESADATEVIATLNSLFERVVPIIQEHGGHVDKFVGDGLLAVFGAPRRREDHADNAFEAAVEIAATVGEDIGDGLRVGIGLNSGMVVAGNVGGAGRLEFSVIGDAVNVAARVEAATRDTGDTVLISDGTRRRLRRCRVEFDQRDGIALKGKREPVTLFAPRTRADREAEVQTK